MTSKDDTFGERQCDNTELHDAHSWDWEKDPVTSPHVYWAMWCGGVQLLMPDDPFADDPIEHQMAAWAFQAYRTDAGDIIVQVRATLPGVQPGTGTTMTFAMDTDDAIGLGTKIVEVAVNARNELA